MSRPHGPAPFVSRVAPQHVELRVDTSPVAAATVRAVAADLACRSEYTLDAVADLRLAVDEVCATLLAVARAGTRLTCTFDIDEERMTVTASVSTTARTVPPADTFGWRVLETLTEGLHTLSDTPRHPGQAHRVAVRMSVPRAGAVVGPGLGPDDCVEGGRA